MHGLHNVHRIKRASHVFSQPTADTPQHGAFITLDESAGSGLVALANLGEQFREVAVRLRRLVLDFHAIATWLSKEYGGTVSLHARIPILQCLSQLTVR